MDSKNNLFINVLYLVSAIMAGAFIAILSINNLLPIKLRLIVFSIIVIAYIIIGLLIIKKEDSKSVFYTSTAILLIFGIVLAFASYYIQNTYSSYNRQMAGSGTEIVEYSVVTRIDNPVTSLEELSRDTIYYDSTEKQAEVDQVLQAIDKVNKSLDYEEGDNSVSLAIRLIDQDIDYMILNTSKLSLINEQEKDFESKIKILALANQEGRIKVERDIQDIAKDVKPGESFNVLITGADTDDGLYANTRSDVNILVTVNPKTNQILMTSIPRDSYVYMTGLGEDKLTHAGTYGMSTLVSTVEELLDTDINYYAKVNFTSMIKLVDILGGVTVYNEQGFTAVVNKKYYPQGEIYLDGADALAFVRERYAFSDGDFARGRNQMKVLEAMIKKAMSPAILLNYNSILDTVLGSVNTNVPTDKITELVNLQLDKNPSWDIKQNQISGEPTQGLPSFAMPGYDLFMTVLDEDSLSDAMQKINSVLIGN